MLLGLGIVLGFASIGFLCWLLFLCAVFELVPWSPSLEKQRGREVSGIMRGDGGIDWSFARKRGLGL